MDDLLDFLSHAAKKGIMPAASSRALAVAARNVLGVLDDEEQKNIGDINIEGVIKRFNNKRAKDFNPGSLKAYGQRVQRAIELYEQWKDNPANFSVKTRNSGTNRKPIKTKQNENRNEDIPITTAVTTTSPIPPNRQGTYQSSFPVGPGRVITVSSIPEDLTSLEAEKLAQFVRMLAVE
jgi:hypothetical protein